MRKFISVLLCSFMLLTLFSCEMTDGKHNMSVGIVSVGVVNSDIGAHSFRNEVVLDIFWEQIDPLFFVEFNRQSDH